MNILIAEDDLDVSSIYERALTERGHEVIVTANGKECLEVYLQYYSTRKYQHLEREEHTEKSFNNQARWEEDESKKRPRKETAPTHHTYSPPIEQVPDVVILDYKMPKMNGLQAAKEILQINPNQRIIFASAYVKDTLVESVKELNRVVEMIQKPFTVSTLLDVVEDREAFRGLKKLMASVREISDLDNPSDRQVKELFEGLRKVQKFRSF